MHSTVFEDTSELSRSGLQRRVMNILRTASGNREYAHYFLFSLSLSLQRAEDAKTQ